VSSPSSDAVRRRQNPARSQQDAAAVLFVPSSQYGHLQCKCSRKCELPAQVIERPRNEKCLPYYISQYFRWDPECFQSLFCFFLVADGFSSQKCVICMLLPLSLIYIQMSHSIVTMLRAVCHSVVCSFLFLLPFLLKSINCPCKLYSTVPRIVIMCHAAICFYM
jgi:hypothetical protein